MSEIKIYPLGPLQTNCYVVVNKGRALVIDPGGDPAAPMGYLKSSGVELDCILNTHLHFDHIYGNRALADASGKNIYASDDDLVLMDTEVGRGGLMGFPTVTPFESNNIAAGETELIGLKCRVLATPGHTPGSLTFYFPELQAAFVGDALFRRSIGRTDFPYGNTEQLLSSIKEQIFTLPENTVVYSGHGPETSVGDEKNHNPFFSGMQI
ncbi:MBL fold metallo-hydrolase [Maridesulfovibrio sp. FT414]|uniref:MBL fold metallo-hydrolase n=1 Tax=Maridesulfovibrio sp. FT414 TaxID=2979469 RepID=UPI003D8007B0